jgi:hypothetical protein
MIPEKSFHRLDQTSWGSPANLASAAKVFPTKKASISWLSIEFEFD